MKFWDEQLKIARANTKLRILRYEQLGIGINAMQEKVTLKKIERQMELRKQNGKQV